MPTFVQAIAFLEYRCKALQLIHNSHVYKPTKSSINSKGGKQTHVVTYLLWYIAHAARTYIIFSNVTNVKHAIMATP